MRVIMRVDACVCVRALLGARKCLLSERHGLSHATAIPPIGVGAGVPFYESYHISVMPLISLMFLPVAQVFHSRESSPLGIQLGHLN